MKTAKWATGGIGIILAGYNLVHFFLRESVISKSSGRRACGVVGDYKIILDAVDSALYSFGPFVSMFMTNFAIEFKFMTAKCKSTNETESTNQALAKSATRGTAMVVTVSITFLLLTAPVGLDNAFSSIFELQMKPLFEVFMNVTQYLNHSINGVLYCIVGSRFRSEIFKLLCRRETQETICTIHRINNTNT